jgi:hypothetical protein
LTYKHVSPWSTLSSNNKFCCYDATSSKKKIHYFYIPNNSFTYYITKKSSFSLSFIYWKFNNLEYGNFSP